MHEARAGRASLLALTAAVASLVLLAAAPALAQPADIPPGKPTNPPADGKAPPPPDPKPKVESAGDGDVDIVTSAGKRPKPPPGPRFRQGEPRTTTAIDWRWPKFGLPHLGLMIGQGGLAVGSQAIPGMENWRTTNGFDEAARNVFRIPEYADALIARDASDVGLVLLINQRLIDSLFVTWWFHDKGTTALQLALVDAQTVTFSAGINSFVAGIVGRERPYGRSICFEGDIAESGDCKGSNRFRSFFSGHATAAFTLAALTCAHHIELPIYGGGPVEAIPCVAGMVTASAVALLRVASDQHYLSDVLVGAAFGTASGFAIPYLFYYMHDDEEPSPALKKAGISSMAVGPLPGGLQMSGAF